ncbi:uncharacterized protein [Battus philenor]|uniref:uncharacterized protein n=1 Tax=Battus philenor TaxID=42288 RepID=UPI0035D00D6C
MKWNKLVVLLNIIVLKCWAMSQIELEEFSEFLEKTSQLDLNLKSNPDIENDEDDTVLDNAWEESGKFEGDLILNDRQRRLILEDVAEGLSRNGLRDSTKRWPDNEVVYFIQPEHFTEDQLQAIQSGIDDLAQASCVKFRPYKKGDRDAVVIQGSRRGCFSQVGYQGGYQVLNLNGRHPVGRGCFRHGTIVHELLHTLGFYHMQSSPDRDDYIDVMWENILKPARHNFRKYNMFAVSDFGVGYDYESVLHYSKKAFSSNGQDTLVPKEKGVEIGQRIGLSDKDTQKLNKMYCDSDSNNENEESTFHKSKLNKKENSKNKPFEGHGIGYHQGNTVIIKLPAAARYRIPDLPTFHVFDHFSKTPEAMHETFKEENSFTRRLPSPIHVKNKISNPVVAGKEPLEQHNFSITEQEKIANINKITKSMLKDNIDSYQSKKEDDEKNKNRKHPENDQFNVDIVEQFKNLNNIVKTRVYPAEEKNIYKIRNDYSTFVSSPDIVNNDDKNLNFDSYNEFHTDEKNHKDVNQFYVSHEPVTTTNHKLTTDHSINNNKPSSVKHDQSHEGENDTSFRTLFPLKKNTYQVPEEDLESIKEGLHQRNDYHDLYLQSNKNRDNKQHHIFGEKPPTDNTWNNNDEFKTHTGDYDIRSYSDHITSDGLDSKLYIKTPDYEPQSNFRRYNSPGYIQKEHLLFGVPVPLRKLWFTNKNDQSRDSSLHTENLRN